MRFYFAYVLAGLIFFGSVLAGTSQEPALAGHLVYARTSEQDMGELVVQNMTTGTENVILQRTLPMSNPVLSPDGDRIVFVQRAENSPLTNLHLVNRDGSQPRVLTSSTRTDFDPAWSPDGTRIVYASRSANRRDPIELVVMDIASQTTQSLTNLNSAAIVPDWSAVNNRIAFSSNQQGDYHIYTINPDGSDLRQITAGDDTGFAPVWSPDGDTVAFRGGEKWQSRLVYVDVNEQIVRSTGTISGDPGVYDWLDSQTLLFEKSVATNLRLFRVVRLDGQLLAEFTISLVADSIASVGAVNVTGITSLPTATPVMPPEQPVTVSARIGGNDDNQQTEFGYRMTNTGDAPQGDLATRIFFSPDAGYSYTDYTLDMFYDSSNAASVADPVQWDANTAYFSVDYGISTLAAGALFEFQGQLRLNDYAIGYDSANDFWRAGLTDEYTATDTIPVYSDGALLSGQEPDESTLPTATPAPATATPTPAPTLTPDSGTSLTIRSRLDGQNDNQQATFRYRLLNTGSVPLDNLSVRLYITLDGDYSASDYVLDVFYDQSSAASVTGPFQHSGDVYYFQIDYGTVTLQPNRYWEFNAGLRLQNYATGLDSSNDHWSTGITDTLTETNYLPVYVNGTLATGQQPAP